MKFEKWTSDQNQEEIHFFKEGTNEYLCGFNPKYFTQSQIEYILAHIDENSTTI